MEPPLTQLIENARKDEYETQTQEQEEEARKREIREDLAKEEELRRSGQEEIVDEEPQQEKNVFQ